MQKMKKTVSMVLAGDSFITQRLPRDAKLAALKNYLERFDVRFTNFEILLHDFEVFPAPVSGGTWACAGIWAASSLPKSIWTLPVLYMPAAGSIWKKRPSPGTWICPRGGWRLSASLPL